MANKTIAELTAAATLDGSELIHVVQSGNSRKTTSADLPVSTAVGARLAALVIPGTLYGLTLSNNATDATNDIDVTSGVCASSAATPILMTYAGASGRQLDVAYGSGNGARFDSAISDGTWHAFIISNGTTVGFGYSKSLDPTGQANYPSGYTHYRRIGSILRISSAIRAFVQVGDYFHLSVPANDYTGANSTSASLRSLTVPTGISVLAFGSVFSSVDTNILVTSPAQADTAPGNTVGPLRLNGAQAQYIPVWTDTSGRIRIRSDASGGTQIINTMAWMDTRGKVA